MFGLLIRRVSLGSSNNDGAASSTLTGSEPMVDVPRVGRWWRPTLGWIILPLRGSQKCRLARVLTSHLIHGSLDPMPPRGSTEHENLSEPVSESKSRLSGPFLPKGLIVGVKVTAYYI